MCIKGPSDRGAKVVEDIASLPKGATQGGRGYRQPLA